MKNSSMTEGNFLSNKVEINLNMFCSLMLHWVAGEIYGTDVITIDHGGSARRMVKFNQQLSQPGSFSNTICHSSVFSLGAGPRDGVLALGGPGHQVVT